MIPIKTVLVPLDFSDASHAALRYACRLSECLHASIHVLHVVERPLAPSGYVEVCPPPPDWLDQLEDDGWHLLDDALTADERTCFNVVLVQRTGNAAEEILKYIQENRRIELVVMATHGRGGVARLMMGSTADKVVRHAMCPVLTLTTPVGAREIARHPSPEIEAAGLRDAPRSAASQSADRDPSRELSS